MVNKKPARWAWERHATWQTVSQKELIAVSISFMSSELTL